MTKWLALILMIVDHIGAVFVNEIPGDLYYVLRLFGRLSFPLYTYYIMLGVNRTSNIKKYLMRMIKLAVVSQILLWMVFSGIQLNVLFSFSLYIIYFMIYKDKDKKYIALFLLLLSTFTEYSYSGFILFVILNYLHNNDLKNKQLLASLAIFVVFFVPFLTKATTTRQLFAAFSGLMMFRPQIEQRIFSKNIEKWIFYLFYPAQWIIFKLILIFIGS